VLGAWLVRGRAPRDLLAIGVAAIGAFAIAWWIGALGRLPALDPSAGAFLTATGRGAAAVVIGAGLLGSALAVITKLAHARWLAAAIAIAIAQAILVDHDAATVVALLGIACAVLPAAVVRVIPERRHAVAAVAGVPLVGAALLVGPAFGVDDPGPAPARLASDLIETLSPGPGVIVATRPTTWAAIHHAQVVTGARPDLELVAPARADAADFIVAMARQGRVVGADEFALGNSDPAFVLPRGRGFEFHAFRALRLAAIPPPARYASALGREEAIRLAVDLARFEAGFGRFDAAARAAGLAGSRFQAADLALLATTRPSPSRPSLFGFLPRFEGDDAGAQLDVLGDDLAWVVGIEVPPVEVPRVRKLHALWRALWLGSIKPDDPAIAALGPRAVDATRRMLAALQHE
jgi:hypothetical protein